ncbi:uncharacterized protein LOC123529504 [Mercenaria mercenaria]|uniref:uncharacterized protein LOC123529504 n=1 Tax=Mercenaria mercenaria TaxID=6596 RepID=UPI00234EA345|nr:uncharacterized protein LOC123529504 [Mercenaria mercenaria]
MFRNFYAEQKMADPRDSWYKPNLLYNIHYRPPNPSTHPKMIVVTKEFNPSVCTCGEHGCAPHYRMEREVVWSSKKVTNEADRELKEDVQAERSVEAKRELKEDIQAERNVKANRELKEDIQAERSVKAIWELKEDIQAERIMKAHRKLKADIQAERSAKAHWELKEGIQAEKSAKAHRKLKEDILAERSAIYDDSSEDDIDDAGPKSKDGGEWKMNTDTKSGCSDIVGVSNSFPRLDDLPQHDIPDADVLDTTDTSVRLKVADFEDFGSAFGIMSVYCDSELHTLIKSNYYL